MVGGESYPTRHSKIFPELFNLVEAWWVWRPAHTIYIIFILIKVFDESSDTWRILEETIPIGPDHRTKGEFCIDLHWHFPPREQMDPNHNSKINASHMPLDLTLICHPLVPVCGCGCGCVYSIRNPADYALISTDKWFSVVNPLFQMRDQRTRERGVPWWWWWWEVGGIRWFPGIDEVQQLWDNQFTLEDNSYMGNFPPSWYHCPGAKDYTYVQDLCAYSTMCPSM